MPLHHPDLVPEPEQPTPSGFFSQVLPSALQANEAICTRFGGKLGFTISGKSGGSWTVDLNAARVEDGIANGIAFHIKADSDVFQQMMGGKLDLFAAVRAGKLQIDGDPNILRHLVAILP